MDNGRPQIERLSTGIPRLDTILGGGFPAGSTNIITGGPGTGKSILTLQMLFHQARRQDNCIYFITVSEPAIKFLRYMQQFDFFDRDLFMSKLAFLDLSNQAQARDPTASIEAIKREVADRGPAVIAIDSFKALRERFSDAATARSILYEFFVDLSASQTTTFLVGEYDAYDASHLPEFFSADGIINLSVVTEGLRAARQLEVTKLRGSAYISGIHFFDITPAGIITYPRATVPTESGVAPEAGRVSRLPTGVLGLDQMLDGGLPAQSTTLLQGGTGTGKTLLSLNFLVEGARRGEPGLMFAMEETREQLLEIGASRGWPLEQLDQQGLLKIIYTAPVELAGDALFQSVRDLVEEHRARRVVIDSLSSLELGIASQGRLREIVYALVKTIRQQGVTTIITNEIPELIGTAELTGRGYSSITDNIIILRYVEVGARLMQAISVLKLRGSSHERFLRELRITGDNIEVLEAFQQLRGVLTGVPTPEEN